MVRVSTERKSPKIRRSLTAYRGVTLRHIKRLAMAETLLEVALGCVRRGWHVFPCWPGRKEPRIKGGNLSASNDEAKVRMVDEMAGR
jgi:hypothetical protein